MFIPPCVQQDFPLVLQSGGRVMIYAGLGWPPYSFCNATYFFVKSEGEFDYICNWLGNYEWTLNMTWVGQSAYVNAPNVSWSVDGAVAGFTQSAQNFTFVKVWFFYFFVALENSMKATRC